MTAYNNILVALDVSNEAETVLAHAVEMAEKFEARLMLCHVVEPIAVETNYDIGPTIDLEVEQALMERADSFLQKLIETFNLKDTKTITTIGSPKQELHRICEDEQINLLVIGTHGRHGISILLGSTANAVLHGTNCDVLSVKV